MRWSSANHAIWQREPWACEIRLLYQGFPLVQGRYVELRKYAGSFFLDLDEVGKVQPSSCLSLSCQKWITFSDQIEHLVYRLLAIVVWLTDTGAYDILFMQNCCNSVIMMAQIYTRAKDLDSLFISHNPDMFFSSSARQARSSTHTDYRCSGGKLGCCGETLHQEGMSNICPCSRVTKHGLQVIPARIRINWCVKVWHDLARIRTEPFIRFKNQDKQCMDGFCVIMEDESCILHHGELTLFTPGLARWSFRFSRGPFPVTMAWTKNPNLNIAPSQ